MRRVTIMMEGGTVMIEWTTYDEKREILSNDRGRIAKGTFQALMERFYSIFRDATELSPINISLRNDLPDTIIVGQSKLEMDELLAICEDMLGKQIIWKNARRPLKEYAGRHISLACRHSTYEHPVIIYGEGNSRNKCYILCNKS